MTWSARGRFHPHAFPTALHVALPWGAHASLDQEVVNRGGSGSGIRCDGSCGSCCIGRPPQPRGIGNRGLPRPFVRVGDPPGSRVLPVACSLVPVWHGWQSTRAWFGPGLRRFPHHVGQARLQHVSSVDCVRPFSTAALAQVFAVSSLFHPQVRGCPPDGDATATS